MGFARHPSHHRQRAQDADGEIGQRHRGHDRGRRRRLDRGLRRHDERQRAPARHDASHFVNPNGLPAENHVSSARDLGILARALIKEFPQYDFYWHIHVDPLRQPRDRNYNSLIDRYPGADGMKTGFICASGYNVVASATRNGRRLIAVVLGAYSGAVRAQKAAECWSAASTAAAVLADAVARHGRRPGADRCAAARLARRNVRRSPPQAAGGRQRRRTKTQPRRRQRDSSCGASVMLPAEAVEPSSCSARRSRPRRRSRFSPARPTIRIR